MTRSRVSGLTSVYPFSALETVPTETPLTRASSLIVVRPEAIVQKRFRNVQRVRPDVKSRAVPQLQSRRAGPAASPWPTRRVSGSLRPWLLARGQPERAAHRVAQGLGRDGDRLVE